MMADIKSIADLTPDEENARRHNERNVGMIVNALQEVGAARSIVIDEDGLILAGNATIEAAVLAGIERVRVVDVDGETIVAVRRRGLTAKAKKRLAYFDNRTAELADWSPDQLLADLEGGLDLSGLFGKGELDELLKGLGSEQLEDKGPQIDKAAELQEKWGVKSGDVWEIPSRTMLGKRHQVVCGDSTVGEDIGLDAVLITDPPYGINHDPSWLDGMGTNRQALSSRDVLVGDDGSLDLSFLWQFERRMVWGFPYIYDAAATGWIIWDKQPGVDGRGIVTPVEMASTTMRKGFDMIRLMWGGYYRASGEKKVSHPTQKPIGVIAPFIIQWTKLDDLIYDPFMGAGSTIVACEKTGRIGHGMEIEPKYVAVTLERLTDLGLEPCLLNS